MFQLQNIKQNPEFMSKEQTPITAVIFNGNNPIGERVYWETWGGDRYEGILIEYDNNTAIVRLDNGKEKAI
jgi:small nuclear ribonucleoprotein (snRNP)-like protein